MRTPITVISNSRISNRRISNIGLALLWGILCSPALGQVVQLPSVQSFGTSGSVVVPDQGTAYLGGNRGWGSGLSSSGWGPLGTRTGGSTAGGSSVSASAVIIDLQAMDEALLNIPPESSLPSSYEPHKLGSPIVNTLTPKNYDRMTGGGDRMIPNPNAWMMTLGSPGDAPVRSRETESDVRYFMSLADEAQRLGRVAAAKVYYKMALERMTPAQQQRYTEVKERNAEAYRQGVSPQALAKGQAKSGLSGAKATDTGR